MELTKIFTLCCIAVESSKVLTIFEVTAFAHFLGLQYVAVITCFMLSYHAPIFVLTKATFILQKEEPFAFLSQEAQESIPIKKPLQKKEKSECHWFSSCQIKSPSWIYRE